MLVRFVLIIKHLPNNNSFFLVPLDVLFFRACSILHCGFWMALLGWFQLLCPRKKVSKMSAIRDYIRDAKRRAVEEENIIINILELFFIALYFYICNVLFFLKKVAFSTYSLLVFSLLKITITKHCLGCLR